MKVTEIKSLTGIRGVAALYVIIHHWYHIIPQGTRLTQSFTINSLTQNFLRHGYLSVDLFFALSGFVLSMSSYNTFATGVSLESYRSFMFRRFCRIFPLYICMTLVYFVMLGCLLTFDKVSVSDLLVNLTLLQGIIPAHNGSYIPPGWSLTNEWIIYFTVPFFLFIVHRYVKNPKVLVGLAILFLLIISGIRTCYLNWTDYDKLKHIGGFYTAIPYTRGPSSLLRTIAAYLLGTFAYLVYRQKANISLLGYAILPMIAVLFSSRIDIVFILYIPFLLLYITGDNRLNRLLSCRPVYFLGLISYSLYVNHYLLLYTYKRVAHFLGIQHHLITFSLCYVLAGTFVISLITYYVIEKAGMRFLKRYSAQFSIKKLFLFNI